MLRSRGLQIALAGGVLFLLSAASLLFLPKAGPFIGMLVGAMAVWSGFIWTLLAYYLPSKPPGDG